MAEIAVEGFTQDDNCLHLTHVGSLLFSRDGTEYKVLTNHPPRKEGRKTKERSLTLLDLSTGRGEHDSVEGWIQRGLYVPCGKGQ